MEGGELPKVPDIDFSKYMIPSAKRAKEQKQNKNKES